MFSLIPAHPELDVSIDGSLKIIAREVTDDSEGNYSNHSFLFRRDVETVLKTTLKEVSSSVDMRPKGDALRIGAKIEGFHIEGFPATEVKRRTLLTSDRNAVSMIT